MKDIETFESICSQFGEPLAVWEPKTHPLRQRGLSPFSANPDPVKIAVWKIPDEGEGGVIIGCTWHEGPPHQWHLNAGHRQAVAHLMELLATVTGERDAARQELAHMHAKASEETETLIHDLSMAAWDQGADSGVVWCPDADMTKRGVVPMSQEQGLENSRAHFALHGSGSPTGVFEQALNALRGHIAKIQNLPASLKSGK